MRPGFNLPQIGDILYKLSVLTRGHYVFQPWRQPYGGTRRHTQVSS